MARRISSARPILCAVLDAAALGSRPNDFARGLFESGVDWIQLRDRSLSSVELMKVVAALVDARDSTAEPSGSIHGHGHGHGPSKKLVIVNRRLDVALSAHADGSHLGYDALDVACAARLLPANAAIGLSLHSLAEVESRIREAVETLGRKPSYAHLAPIWDPISKSASRPALGPRLLAKACGLGLPILAQGGIDLQWAIEAIAVGAAGVAVTGTISNSEDPTSAVRQLRAAMDRQSSPAG